MGALPQEVRTDVLCGRICDLEAENAKLREESSKHYDLYVHAITDAEVWHLQWSAEYQENAKLRELVLVLKYCADENGDCDACPINDAKPVRHPWFGCNTLRDMMRELGVDDG